MMNVNWIVKLAEFAAPKLARTEIAGTRRTVIAS